MVAIVNATYLRFRVILEPEVESVKLPRALRTHLERDARYEGSLDDEPWDVVVQSLPRAIYNLLREIHSKFGDYQTLS